MPAKRKHLGNFSRWYRGKLGFIWLFFGANDVGPSVMLVDGIKLRSFVKEPISQWFRSSCLLTAKLGRMVPNAVSLCYGCQLMPHRELPFLRKMTRCVSRWGNLPTSHATTHPRKKKDFNRLEVLERLSKHPSQRCD